MNSMLSSYFSDMIESGNCMTVFIGLIILLFCISLSNENFFETALMLISSGCGLFYFLNITQESSESEYTLSSLVPSFVHHRKIVRRDGMDSFGASQKGSNDEGFNLEKEANVASNFSRKHSKKAKKKKSFAKSKFKMDEINDSTSNNKSDSSQKRECFEKTKVYTPLELYVDMDMNSYDLYQEFKPYVLTKEQLKMYDFPFHTPGEILLSSKYRATSSERLCCRCGQPFRVHQDGRYESATVCRYHPCKTPSYRNNLEAATYDCCNGNYLSPGCITGQYHVTPESSLKDSDFVKTRDKKYLRAHKACTVFALDCEMLYTTNGFEVAKVGIVGVDGLTLYETFVLPEKEVLCYNTTYSGVSANDLKSVTTTLRDVQAYILKLINKDSILVGHGLENDLRALRLIHENIVDTSVAFPHSRGVRFKRSLKSLSSEFLGKTIQDSPSGHDCIEDARTCMQLMLHKIQSNIRNRPVVTSVDENKNPVQQSTLPENYDMQYYPCNIYYDPYLLSFYSEQNCRRNSLHRQYFPAYSMPAYS